MGTITPTPRPGWILSSTLTVLALGEIWITVIAGLALRGYVSDCFPRGFPTKPEAILFHPLRIGMAIGFFVFMLMFMIHLRTLAWLLPAIWMGNLAKLEDWLKARINMFIVVIAGVLTNGLFGITNIFVSSWVVLYFIWTCVGMWVVIQRTTLDGQLENEPEVFVGIVVPSDGNTEMDISYQKFQKMIEA